MGAWYEILYIDGAYRLVYQDETTEWSEKSKKLTEDQLDAYVKLAQKQTEEMRNLLRSFKESE